METNEKLKSFIKSKNIKLWQVADKLGIYDTNFSKMLRYKLKDEELNKVYKAVKELEREKNEWWCDINN